MRIFTEMSSLISERSIACVRLYLRFHGDRWLHIFRNEFVSVFGQFTRLVAHIE